MYSNVGEKRGNMKSSAAKYDEVGGVTMQKGVATLTRCYWALSLGVYKCRGTWALPLASSSCGKIGGITRPSAAKCDEVGGVMFGVSVAILKVTLIGHCL